ncbi:IDEAL domain-containing protein [Bacillus sp. DNRA2]|uniref:IDEAL domain-containing protein n=1 Tax=Bacillus sp. DNRA2 TaxID=2723053 RepID=UPI002006E029|nr:IDEAL domain-containing protein [Bacillus sp. DNRA2]
MDHKMPNFMKQNHHNAPKRLAGEISASDSLIAEMLLEKSLIDFRIQQLKKEIDYSLVQGNKEEFLKLTDELKRISA